MSLYFIETCHFKYKVTNLIETVNFKKKGGEGMINMNQRQIMCTVKHSPIKC